MRTARLGGRKVRRISRSFLSGTSLVAILAAGVPAAADAATLYWDANGPAPFVGGDGSWNTTALTWSLNSDGMSGPFQAWVNGTFNGAVFAGSGGTVVIDDDVDAQDLLFHSDYILRSSGGARLILAGWPFITVAAGVTADIEATISGTTGFVKIGGGTLRLSGMSDFAGSIGIIDGRVEAANLDNAGAASSLGLGSTNPAEFVFENGTLAYVGAANATTNRGMLFHMGGPRR